MLMPGDNADQHWIWALPTDRVSQGMYSDRVAGDATWSPCLRPDQRHELLVHRRRRPWRRAPRSGLRTAAGPLRPPSVNSGHNAKTTARIAPGDGYATGGPRAVSENNLKGDLSK